MTMMQCEVYEDDRLGACLVRGNPEPCAACLSHFAMQARVAKDLREGGYETTAVRRNLKRLERKSDAT